MHTRTPFAVVIVVAVIAAVVRADDIVDDFDAATGGAAPPTAADSGGIAGDPAAAAAPPPPAPPSIPVCVTGVSGYVGSVLTATLVSEGLTVHGTVRDAARWSDEPFFSQRIAAGTVELHAADLLGGPAPFARAFAPCKGGVVHHTASPFWRRMKDIDSPYHELIEPAVNGTRDVLLGAMRAGVSLVVVTSSCAAVTAQHPDKVGKGDPAYEWSEADWNLDSTALEGPYRLSKRLAEQKAWQMHKRHGDKLAVVAMNPAFVLGPPVLPRASGESVGFMAKLLGGHWAAGLPDEHAFGVVDVRDLAGAHLAAQRNWEAPLRAEREWHEGTHESHGSGIAAARMHSERAYGKRDSVVGERFVLASRLSYTPLDVADMLRLSLETEAFWKDGSDARDTALPGRGGRGKGGGKGGGGIEEDTLAGSGGRGDDDDGVDGGAPRAPKFPLPRGLAPGAQHTRVRKLYNHAKAEKVLGTYFRPVADTVVDMARTMLALGLVDLDAARGAAEAQFAQAHITPLDEGEDEAHTRRAAEMRAKGQDMRHDLDLGEEGEEDREEL